MYVCYVHFKKAFDRINCAKLMAILADIGLEETGETGIFLKELYLNQKPGVRQTLFEACSIGRGVKHGCLL